jgi:hypothetical protein
MDANMVPEVPPFAAPAQGGLLSKYYFRVPGLHIRLPTNGAFMPLGSVELTQAGDLPVFPMRAADEMLLKSPDALMSGYAIEKLIESCVPGIKLPRAISSPDLDVLLLAIRAATFGEKMPLTANCPNCGTENEFECDLSAMLATVKDIEPDLSVRLTDDLVAYIRPYNLENATQMALTTFEEMLKAQNLEGSTADQRLRSASMNTSFERITKLNLEMLADCVIKVVVPEGETKDRKEIRAFIADARRDWVTKLDNRLKEVNERGVDKKIEVRCSNCSNEWKTDVEFNPATFFASGSSE